MWTVRSPLTSTSPETANIRLHTKCGGGGWSKSKKGGRGGGGVGGDRGGGERRGRRGGGGPTHQMRNFCVAIKENTN